MSECIIDRDDLGPAEQAELDEIVQAHGVRWVIVGPCLDGAWYAMPRRDDGAPRPEAASLAGLGVKLRESGDAVLWSPGPRTSHPWTLVGPVPPG
ncbi:MAG: hypothetical protein ACRDNF_09570 [Streptosporangiaceae bacterium]